MSFEFVPRTACFRGRKTEGFSGPLEDLAFGVVSMKHNVPCCSGHTGFAIDDACHWPKNATTKCTQVCLCFGLRRHIDTWQEQALHHMPGWLTLAEQVQTPYQTRVLKNTCKQVMSFAPGLNSMTTPVQSAQQLGSQTDQV